MIVDQNHLLPDMSGASAIEVLARRLSEATTTITSYLQRQTTSTTDSSRGSFAVPHDAPLEVTAAKRVLLEATSSLQQLVMSPTDLHLQCTVHLQQLASYRWLLNFSIPDHVPLETSIDYLTLAQLAKVPEHQLTRLARLAMTGGFFQEPTPGRIAHTTLSAGFCSDSPLRDTMLFLTETNLPTATKIVEMTRQSQEDPRPSSPPAQKTAFQLAHNTTVPFFPYLSQHPQVAQRLASGMRTVAASLEASPSHLLTSFDWSSLPHNAHVIDLGGSHGHVSLFLARHFPTLRFTIQDLPPVIASAPPPPPELQERVKFQAQSFLDPQPEATTSRGADAAGATPDVLLIRQCLNNWPHATAVQILRHLVPCLITMTATKPHSRILINNIVVPTPFSTIRRPQEPSTADLQQQVSERVGVYAEGSSSSSSSSSRSMRDEALARTRDAVMLQLMDGVERDLPQWQRLLAEVDARLEIVAVRRPTGSLLSLIEVALRRADRAGGIS